MHVVPTVEVQACTTLDTYEIEAGFDGNPARRQIVHRVCQFQAVEPDVVERPPCRGSNSAGCDILSASRWHRPICHLTLTADQVHILERNPPQQIIGNGVCGSERALPHASPRHGESLLQRRRALTRA